MSHKHSSIQYEGVTTMAKDGYGEMSCISCCVSPLDPENEEQRHNIQYFGARVNVLKALLTGLNGGYDVFTKTTKSLILTLSVTKFLTLKLSKLTLKNHLIG